VESGTTKENREEGAGGGADLEHLEGFGDLGARAVPGSPLEGGHPGASTRWDTSGNPFVIPFRLMF